MQATVTAIGPNDQATFTQLFQIYRAAIEPSEQKPAEQFVGMLRDARYAVLVARAQAEVTGFAMAFFPTGADFWLLEYMAVSAHKRSQGIGEMLFAAACSVAASRAGAEPCVLEVDQPTAAASATNEPARRLRFYARSGCRRIAGLNYILPLDTAGQPPPMNLLVHGLCDTDRLSAAQVRRWLTTIYRDVYGCPGDDPRIDRMLAAKETGFALECL